MFRNKASAESCFRKAGSLVMIVLLFDKLADGTNSSPIAAKEVPSKRLVIARIAGNASITTTGLQRPMKKRCITSLLPGRYKPPAKFVPGIAVKIGHFRRFFRIFSGFHRPLPSAGECEA